MRDLRHHSLVAWQRADDLFLRVHKLATGTFPASERFELSTQLRKAAYSVPANIAEGFARRHPKDRPGPPALPALFHFNMPGALADLEHRLRLRGRAVDHTPVVERELGSMPWADDGAVFELAFRQRTTEV